MDYLPGGRARSITGSNRRPGGKVPNASPCPPPSRLRQNAPATGLPARSSTLACNASASRSTKSRAARSSTAVSPCSGARNAAIAATWSASRFCAGACSSAHTTAPLPATGVMVFAWGSLHDKTDRVDAMGAFYRGIRPK